MRRKLGSVAIATALVFGAVACGGGEKVGEQFEDFEGQGGNDRLGEIERTPKPTTKAGKTAAPGAAATAAPAKTAAAPSSVSTVKITSAGFDPTELRNVVQGSTVKVTNTDSAAHSYTSSDNVTYDTKMIPAGGSASFVANKVGRFQMEDRSRNWIVGAIEVVPG
jgi:plastocyanin